MNSNGAKFLIHLEGDSVGVATYDLKSGESVTGVFMNDGKTLEVKALNDIPLGHKIALKDVKRGEKVVEYGEQIGNASSDIKKGEHVHTHNLKSARW